MVKKTAAFLMALMLGLAVLSGCSDKKESESETGSAAGTTSADTTAAAESESGETEADPYLNFDYSYGLSDNGFIEGIKASDYVTVPDFTTFSFKRSEAEPTESEVQQPIDTMLQSFTVEVTDRAVESGDKVNIDYSGSVDGVKFDRGSAEGAEVTAGTNQFIDDFLYQIIGHMPGETMDVEVTFPDPYTSNPDLAGKDAVFVVTINYITETPTLTDEWVKDNLESLRAYFGTDKIEKAEDIRTFIHDYYFDYYLDGLIYNRLVEEVQASEIPESAHEIAKRMTDISLYMNYGVDTAQFIELGGATEEDMEESINIDAKLFLLYQAIAEQEGWTDISEADFKEATGLDDNSEVIATYGRGYIAKYIISMRAEAYMKELIQLEEDGE